MTAPLQKALLYGWGAGQVLQHGRPDVALGFLGGIGDDLLCTAPIHEWLQRDARRIWFLTRHPQLYGGIDRRVRLIPEDARFQALAARLGRPVRFLSYSQYDAANDRDSSVSEHVIAAMCRRAGLTGPIRLRPYLKVTDAELAQAAQWKSYVVVQSSSMNAVVPMRTKQWPVAHMQQVVAAVSAHYPCVQIGSATDPLLENVVDMRGKSTLRESAAILVHGRLFVGLVGFLMHLARAVDCPAVVVYGGREPAELTGYPCNINVAHRPACSPCWRRTRCDFDLTCMSMLPPIGVISAVNEMLNRPRESLATTEVTL